jgi:dCMP deaminase
VKSEEEVVETKNVHESQIQMFMHIAYETAQLSTDLSTKNGAILIRDSFPLVSGFNHHVRGFEGVHERPLKYDVTEHAERAVIYAAAKFGIQTDGLTLVANWVACPDCARAIVEAGIRQVICHKECQDRTNNVRPDGSGWKESVALGLNILKKGGVELIEWSGHVGIENLNNGEIWTP